jgi:hydrogenase maturation protein HypF
MHAAATPMLEGHVRVRGVVQGVGFRPFVYRLAGELKLQGWVLNDGEGVEIAVRGEPAAVETLLNRLRSEAPGLARVDTVEFEARVVEPVNGFEIRASLATGAATGISPDAAICPDCLADLFDPRNRRYRYPFTNCTHCGPRYTITGALPYDRPNTTMARFKLCADCEAEYHAPADRRFHAQPNACPACGPRLWIEDGTGHEVCADDPFCAALELILSGEIVAVKGLGGFHLLCNARDAEAVARLRARKQREEKPFAVMFANMESIAGYAAVDAAERRLLESRDRPVVLLRKQPECDAQLAGIAPGIAWLGAMLPYTPIHYLIFHEAARRVPGTAWLAQRQPLALVCTSANPGGEPLVTDNAEAIRRLHGIADAFLLHDRDILIRCDDSVVRAVADGDSCGRPAPGPNGSNRDEAHSCDNAAPFRGEDAAPTGAGASTYGRPAPGPNGSNRDEAHSCGNAAPLRGEGAAPTGAGASTCGRPAPGPNGSNRDEAHCDNAAPFRGEGAAPTGGTFIRRARGYTPRAIKLARAGPSVLACGAWFKNTICLTRGNEAFLSQHIGDLDNGPACAALDEAVDHLMNVLEIEPVAVAHDLHPDFYSTRFAAAFAAECGLPAIAVQHHHAHIAAVLAEHGHEGPALGLALDGVGLGSDGTAWGGELLRVDGARCARLGHLRPLHLPGGDRAAREPWRMGAAALFALGRTDAIERRWPGAASVAVEGMLTKGFNSPLTTSAGRWFDAAAGLLGVSAQMGFEGQAAMLLEGLAEAHGPTHALAGGFSVDTDGTLDLLPLLGALSEVRDAGYGAALFHATLVEALHEWSLRAAQHTAITTVALGGGCFLNHVLTRGLVPRLRAQGITVLQAQQAPPNDGGIALGQAWIAMRSFEENSFQRKDAKGAKNAKGGRE